VTVAVIDGLEVVQIQEQQRTELVGLALLAREGHERPVLEEAAVGQAREVVVHGTPRHQTPVAYEQEQHHRHHQTGQRHAGAQTGTQQQRVVRMHRPHRDGPATTRHLHLLDQGIGLLEEGQRPPDCSALEPQAVTAPDGVFVVLVRGFCLDRAKQRIRVDHRGQQSPTAHREAETAKAHRG